MSDSIKAVASIKKRKASDSSVVILGPTPTPPSANPVPDVVDNVLYTIDPSLAYRLCAVKKGKYLPVSLFFLLRFSYL